MSGIAKEESGLVGKTEDTLFVLAQVGYPDSINELILDM